MHACTAPPPPLLLAATASRLNHWPSEIHDNVVIAMFRSVEAVDADRCLGRAARQAIVDRLELLVLVFARNVRCLRMMGYSTFR